MKTAISLPDDLFARGERFAAQHGKNRSELIAEALHEYLLRHGDDAVTAQLDTVYHDLPAEDSDQAVRSTMNRKMARDNPW